MDWLQRWFGTSGPTSSASPARSKPTSPRLAAPLGSSPHEDRCIGCLLGGAMGDALGSGVEFKSRREIEGSYGRLEDYLDFPDRPGGTFTDDTEMTLALASSLVENGRLDPAACAAAYVHAYYAEPRRGYGPSVSHILAMLRHGADHRTSGRLVHPEGSYANGGAMRIAPVGLAFRHAEPAALREAVRGALVCTHVHPGAVDGAFVQASAVAALARCERPEALDLPKFLHDLLAGAEEEATRRRLTSLVRGLAEKWNDETFLAAVCTPNDFGPQFQIHAAEAVASALWAFAHHPHDPEACIVHAVGLGGDCDTVGALAGSLGGALHGSAWTPLRWFDPLENRPGVGRDHLVELARGLARLDLRKAGAYIADRNSHSRQRKSHP